MSGNKCDAAVWFVLASMTPGASQNPTSHWDSVKGKDQPREVQLCVSRKDDLEDHQTHWRGVIHPYVQNWSQTFVEWPRCSYSPLAAELIWNLWTVASHPQSISSFGYVWEAGKNLTAFLCQYFIAVRCSQPRYYCKSRLHPKSVCWVDLETQWKSVSPLS